MAPRQEPISEDELVGMEGSLFTDLVRISRKVAEVPLNQLSEDEQTALARDITRPQSEFEYSDEITLVRNSLEVILGRLSELQV